MGAAPDQHPLLGEAAVGVDRRVGLGDDVLLLFVRGQVAHLVGDLAVDHGAVGRLDEAVLVDPRVGGQRPDEADVGALGRLNGAHAPVVGRVDVTHLEAGALARQAAGAERREASLVGQARERVVLVHELGQLRGAEELLHRGDHRPDVDEGLRGDGLDVLGRHALAHDALHARQPDTHLVLNQLAHRADAAVGEVVLVVDAVGRLAVGHVQGQVQHVAGRGQDLRGAEHALVGRGLLHVDAEEVVQPVDLGTELAVELVPPDPGQVVALGVEEGVLEVDVGGLGRQRLAGTGPLVDLEQRLFARRREVALLLPLPLEEVEVPHEAVQEGLVAVAQGAQEHEEGEAALAGDAAAGGDVLARLRLNVELDPLTAVRVDGPGEHGLGVAPGLEDDARRADQLAHHHALGAVDDERAAVGHHREVPHEDRLLLDLAGGGVEEAGPHEDGRRVGHVLLLALLHRELGRRAQVGVGRVELELEAQLAGEVLDRADVGEGLGQPLVEEPLERVALNGDQVRERQGLVDVGERNAFGAAGP